MKETPHFRAVCDHDLPNLEQMIFALYREDEYGEVMSRQKIQYTVQELMQHPEKGTIIVIFWVKPLWDTPSSSITGAMNMEATSQ
jgi:hypothetical protein